MLLKMLCPALVLVAPAVAFAAPAYEPVRAPAGKTVMQWRQVGEHKTTVISCPPDSTKAAHCGAIRAQQIADARAERAERLSER